MLANQTIVVIDYGMGNLHSASKALEHVAPNARVIITSDPNVIRDADRVVFPGVGAIRDCMTEIKRLGFDTLLPELIAEKPLLGICVGMQALMLHSAENNGVDCIGLMPGQVHFFGQDLQSNDGERLKVPHMGWNSVEHDDHPMWQNIEQHTRFYFVHSYYIGLEHLSNVSGTAHYGKDLVAAIAKPNLFAVQFHPEKSHESGLQLLRNFVNWSGSS